MHHERYRPKSGIISDEAHSIHGINIDDLAENEPFTAKTAQELNDKFFNNDLEFGITYGSFDIDVMSRAFKDVGKTF